MKKLILIFTGLISLSFAVIVIGVLFLTNLDLNNHKDWLSEQFYKQTGLELTINGNIESSIYPWLGLDIEGLSIANLDGFSNEPLLVADKAAFRIKLMPMLKQAYEIDTIKLSGANLNLEVNTDGVNNWSGVANSSSAEPTEASDAGDSFNLNQIIIGGVNINSVQVNYLDQANNRSISANNVNITIPELIYGEPLGLEMDFQLSAMNPDIESNVNLSTTLRYDLDNSIYTIENLTLNILESQLQADLRSDNGNIDGTIAFNTEQSQALFALLGQTDLVTRLEGTDSAINLSSTVSYDGENNNFSIGNLDLEFLGSQLEADLRSNDGDINGSINFTTERTQELFTLAGQEALAERINDIRLMVFLDGDNENIQLLPVDINLGLTGSPLLTTTNLHMYSNAEIDIEDENLMLDDFSISILDTLLTGRFNISNFLSEAEIDGELDIESFNPKTLNSALDIELPQTRDPNVLEQIAFSTSLNLTSESIELNRFIFEVDDTLLTGSLSADDFNQAEVSFDIDMNTLDIDRYLAPEQSTASGTNNQESDNQAFTTLQNLQLAGEISIDELKVSGLTMQDMLIGINADQGLIALEPVQTNLYQGSLRGVANLNVNNALPQFNMQSTLQNINIESLSNDFIGASYASGNGNISLALAGSGSDAQTILANLNGNAELTLAEGILQGVDVGAVLTQLETMIRSRQLLSVQRGEQTAFENLSASVQIENGIARSNDLLLQAPGFNVSGTGTLANLQNQSINFDLLASVDPASATVESEEYDIGGYSLPINCSGSMNAPSCLPDINSIVSEAVGSVLQEGIGSVLGGEGVGGLLDRVLGSGNSSETATTPESENGNNNAEATEAEAVDPVEDLLNNALDRIFR